MNHTSFTLGTHVEAITDQEPLVPVYNSLAKPKQLRVDRHRTKLLLFSYDVTYEPGAKTRCNYGLRHPPQHIFTQQEIDDWCIEDGTDIYVNRVLEDILPSAITLNIVKSETAADNELNLLSQNVRSCEVWLSEISWRISQSF